MRQAGKQFIFIKYAKQLSTGNLPRLVSNMPLGESFLFMQQTLGACGRGGAGLRGRQGEGVESTEWNPEGWPSSVTWGFLSQSGGAITRFRGCKIK